MFPDFISLRGLRRELLLRAWHVFNGNKLIFALSCDAFYEFNIQTQFNSIKLEEIISMYSHEIESRAETACRWCGGLCSCFLVNEIRNFQQTLF